MSQPKLLTDFESLVEFLEQEKVPHQVDLDNQKIIFPTKFKTLESELLILWDIKNSLIQCIHLLPFEVPETRITAAESAITWINHELMLPGFGLNHERRFLYYRLSLPLRDDASISAEEFQQLVQTCIRTAADFYSPLLKVVFENMNPSLVLDIAASQKSSEN
jgi:hypothetical protein